MNIKKKINPLFEQDLSIGTGTEPIKIKMTPPKQQQIESVMNVKSKQFKFSSGVFMAGIKYDTGNKFGLFWHKANTKSVDEFIKSISE